MTSTLLSGILTLCALGTLAAVILYVLAQKFKVYEDPRIDQVEEVLPAANCGACGYAGCRHFAETIVKADDLSGLYCPVGGNECMRGIAEVMGVVMLEQDPKIAVVRCSGSFENRPRTSLYDSAKSCAIASSLFCGDTNCSYGCFGLGDCVRSCRFDAIHIDMVSGLPIVIEEKCTGCGACITACPKDIIELRNQGKRSMRVFVSCINRDKGAVARRAGKVACIGCGKCVKECPFDAITLENNLAYIDFEKCKLCRKCVPVCPTKSIHEVGFPPRKKPEDKPAESAGSQQS